MVNKMIVIAGVVLAILVLMWFVKSRKKTPTTTTNTTSGGKPTIYGSMGCPYTVKQIEKYPDHTFVDCTAEKCPEFVTAYPTTKWPDGKIEVGFSN